MEKSDKRFWQTFGGTVRKALNNCPMTPAQAQAELDKLKPADALPFTDDEIARSIEKVLAGDLEPEAVEPDLSWTADVDTAAVEDDALVLNRNRGDEDADVDARVDELRRQALDEKRPDDEDEPGLENRAQPPPKRG